MASQLLYYVYIMASKSRVLYIGVTGDIARRVWQHKQKKPPGFTSRYNVTQLVHCECFENVWDALRREKQLKGWLRSRKIALIEENNPNWMDLSDNI